MLYSHINKKPEHTRHILSRFMDAVKSSLADPPLFPHLSRDLSSARRLV